MSRWVRVGLAFAALMVLAPSPGRAASTVTVSIKTYLFSPPNITLTFGQPVTWLNQEDKTAPLPGDKRHNLIEDLYQAPGALVPTPVPVKVICPAFDSGKSCALTSTTSASLLPRGRHILSCTIDRDHQALMRFVIDVT